MTKKKGCVPVRVTVVVMKHHDQKQLREERVSLVYRLNSIMEEIQCKNSKQEPRGRNYNIEH